jgi:hypothetical protein
MIVRGEEVAILLGCPVEKPPFFQMGHMTKVSTQFHSSTPQYDVHKVALKKLSRRYPLGGVKVNIFAPRPQQVDLVLGFWCFLALWSS